MNVDSVVSTRQPVRPARVGPVVGALIGLPFLLLSLVHAEPSGDEDKSRYNLFRPTPQDQMREFNTDRPDKTESPYTVDAGHLQIEMDLIAYGYDHDTAGGADVVRNEYAVTPVNIKVGLLNQVDLQLVLAPFNHVRTRDRTTGAVSEQQGFGDLLMRLKVNLWGNDGGRTAFGVMPFVKFPTSQDGLGNDAYEGGLIIPFAVELPAGWKMGMMTEFDFNEDTSGSGRHTEFINSVTFDHKICRPLGGYIEFFSLVSNETGADWIGTVDLGLTYSLNANMQLDAGVNIRVTEPADDVNPFVGFSVRF